MKQLIFITVLAVLMQPVAAQNVGIGETNPGVRLTVKGPGFEPGFLVKNSNDDSILLADYSTIRLGGVHSFATGVVSISNKHFLPTDPAQLELIAHGERESGFANGSLNIIKFSNSHSNKYFQLSSYLGGDAARRSFSLSYLDPDDGTSTIHNFLYVSAAGNLGVSTHEPIGRMQVNHRAISSNPTLALIDSTTSFNGPILHFGHMGGSNYYQLRSYINNGSPSTTYLDFATQTGAKMTLRGDGNVGISNTDPTERLDVNGNVKVGGEIIRTATGTANLVPICYGHISAAGTIFSGSGNFAVTHPSTGNYRITIAGESFVYSQYTTSATPAGSTPAIVAIGSGGGIMQVRTWDHAGVATDSGFTFVVYKQ